MAKNKYRLVLASSSPRRFAILSQLGLQFKVLPIKQKEVICMEEDPNKAAKRLAKEKVALAQKSLKGRWDFILAADTIVCIGNKILGKPKNLKDASKMLRLLSGKTHRVITGIAILAKGEARPICAAEATQVTFSPLSEKDISWYLSTGEPLGKAGSYAIQGLGALFVRRINGCFYNVVGLPVYRLWTLFQKAGYSLLHKPPKSIFHNINIKDPAYVLRARSTTAMQ